jgi:hypothetical protein
MVGNYFAWSETVPHSWGPFPTVGTHFPRWQIIFPMGFPACLACRQPSIWISTKGGGPRPPLLPMGVWRLGNQEIRHCKHFSPWGVVSRCGTQLPTVGNDSPRWEIAFHRGKWFPDFELTLYFRPYLRPPDAARVTSPGVIPHLVYPSRWMCSSRLLIIYIYIYIYERANLSLQRKTDKEDIYNIINHMGLFHQFTCCFDLHFGLPYCGIKKIRFSTLVKTI